MDNVFPSRREFFKTATVATVGVAALGDFSIGRAAETTTPTSKGSINKNSRPQIGCIGLRYQGSVIALKSQEHGDIVAVCDVDANVREQAKAAFGSTPQMYEDYHELLGQKGVDVVTIGAPDHWHTKMLIDACRAGKDVYCEKPLTLTIDEGKLIRNVVKETGRVVQVGSWQRSDNNFRLAVEMVRQGRLGRLKKVEVVLGKNELGGPFQATAPPPNMNWDMWQGQTPDVPYIYQRSHYTFRWWYEYSGGQMTDWGAHHVDIAQWAINEYPSEIEGKATFPKVDNGFNVAVDFDVKYTYPSGLVMTVSDTGRNGIMFTGEKGRIFVDRGRISGKPVEDLAQNPLPREAYKLYEFDNLERPPRSDKMESIINHMGNFFDCVAARKTPISDVESQHRSVSSCHLANISMRLGRPLKWDANSEQFVGDPEADKWLRREQRAKYEVA